MKLAEKEGGPPSTRIDPVRDALHGTEVADPYRWLEDSAGAEARAWIAAQGEYTSALLGALPWREPLERRAAALSKSGWTSLPIERGSRLFFHRKAGDEEQQSLLVREGMHGPERVLARPPHKSPAGPPSIHACDVAPDGSLLVYHVQEGREQPGIRLLDVDSGQELPDRLPPRRYLQVFLRPDKRGVYYSYGASEGPRVAYHAIGTDAAADPVIFGEGCPQDAHILPVITGDGRYLLLSAFQPISQSAFHFVPKTDLYIQDLEGQGPPEPIITGVEANFNLHVAGDRLFVHTTWDAPNGRVFEVDLRRPQREHWREVMPESDARIAGVYPLGGRLLVSYFQNAAFSVKLFEADGRHVRDVELPSPGTFFGATGEWCSQDAFLNFFSFHIPNTVYHYRLDTGHLDPWERLPVPVESDRLTAQQVWCRSKDGTRLPMFLVHARDLQPDGSHPALLIGGGPPGGSLAPIFTPEAVLWAEAGGVFAAANVRGGGEFGHAWRDAGLGENKQNAVDDFIAAAQWLIDHQYASPAKLAASGPLAGAAITQRPELFRAATWSQPMADLVRYHHLMLPAAGKFLLAEYGSPDDPEQFLRLLALSPYHQAREGVRYPAVMLLAGDGDEVPRPAHALKMAARLQPLAGPERPTLLRFDLRTDYAGSGWETKRIAELADRMAFLFWQLGMEPHVPASPPAAPP